MDVYKVEIFKDDNFVKGYGFNTNPTPEEFVWNKIIEYMQDNPNKKFIKYLIKDEFEENVNLPRHIVKDLQIPRGTLTRYLTIITEDK